MLSDSFVSNASSLAPKFCDLNDNHSSSPESLDTSPLTRHKASLVPHTFVSTYAIPAPTPRSACVDEDGTYAGLRGFGLVCAVSGIS
jgi:hypothetical protein